MFGPELAPFLLQAVRAGHSRGQHGAEANGQVVQRHQSPRAAGLQVCLLGCWMGAPEGMSGGRDPFTQVSGSRAQTWLCRPGPTVPPAQVKKQRA